MVIFYLKVEGLATDQEKCEVLMIMLRQVCEAKQREHIHISDNTKTTIKYDVSDRSCRLNIFSYLLF